MTSTDAPATKAVMVLDDEDDIIFILRKSLELAGYGAFAFTDPLLALEHLKTNVDRYGLIITDVRMPRMSGIEFAAQVRTIAPSMPVILMSAFKMSDLQIPSELNIAMLLQKPVTPIQLRKLVSKYISPAKDTEASQSIRQ